MTNRKTRYTKLDVIIHDSKKHQMTEEKYNEFVDDFIRLVEDYGWIVGGALEGPLREDELEALEKNT